MDNFIDNNKRGFTLIELLAVIVVLAVVMLIGVNAVLPQMDKARRNSFSIEVNGFVKSAQQQFVVSQLGNLVLSEGETCCVDLDTLVANGQSDLKTSDGYTGYVLIANIKGNIIYKPYLANKKFTVNDTTFGDEEDINKKNVNISYGAEHVQPTKDPDGLKTLSCVGTKGYLDKDTKNCA